MRRRTAAVLAACLVAASLGAAAALAGHPLLHRAGHPAWRAAALPGGGMLALRGGLPVAEIVGSPAERGRQAAALYGRQAADLLAVMALNPRLAPASRGERLRADLAAVRPRDREEIAAFAAAAGLDAQRLLLANATIETMCSAVADTGTGLVARNMDFFPAGPLGKATVVQVVREPGRMAYAAITWPGMFGVISGMNEAGLSGCILLNWRGAEPPPGEPLALRLRAILQDCRDVPAAVAAMAAAPAGSRHYVLFADGRDAAVTWWTPQGLASDGPRGRWLVASNWIRDGGGPRADDLRGGSLVRACAALGTAEPERAWFRRVLSSSYMPGLNAQAMVLDPRARRIELALAGTDAGPAALAAWCSLDLAPVLSGAPVSTLAVTALPAVSPMPHYLLGLPP